MSVLGTTVGPDDNNKTQKKQKKISNWSTRIRVWYTVFSRQIYISGIGSPSMVKTKEKNSYSNNTSEVLLYTLKDSHH